LKVFIIVKGIINQGYRVFSNDAFLTVELARKKIVDEIKEMNVSFESFQRKWKKDPFSERWEKEKEYIDILEVNV
jgi:hypothetical protein